MPLAGDRHQLHLLLTPRVFGDYWQDCLLIGVTLRTKAVHVIIKLRARLKLYPATIQMQLNDGPEFMAHYLLERLIVNVSATAENSLM